MRTRHIAGLIALVVLLAAVIFVYWPGGGDPDSPEPARRLAAIAELRGSTDEKAVSTLHRLSRDPVPLVAVAAVKAIGAAPESNHQTLKQILTESDSGAVRGEAAAELGKCKQVKTEILTEVMRTDKDPQARAGAARGLSRRRDRGALEQLVAALEDGDPRVRLWAITAISRTTAMRFDYDAGKSPEQQQDKISVIKKILRDRFDFR